MHLQSINQLYAPKKQTGAALILIAFLLVLLAASYMVKSLQGITAQSKQDEKTMQALNEAKAALIAWSVSHPLHPGQMPFPDRASGGGYDGNSDCYSGAFQYSFLLGQLPNRGQSNPCIAPLIGINGDWRDAQGNNFWYAVSRNLVHQYESPVSDPVINPNIINTPTYNWLQVLDRNGNLISNRVAAVIIAPGSPNDDQDRSLANAGASEYLDSFFIGATIYSNRAYATDDEDFVIGENSKHVTSSDNTFVKPYRFNDKLVYITIDELMAALERRVGEVARNALKEYEDTNGYYPYAANIDGNGPANNKTYHCTNNNLSGALPVDNATEVCTYSSTPNSVNTSCNFKNITSIEFQGIAGSFNQASGFCTRASTTRCTCTGAGMCRHTTNPSIFSCDSSGNCNGANLSGAQRVRFLGSGFDAASSFCVLGALNSACPRPTGYRVVTCNNNTAITVPQVTLSYCADSITSLPPWFTTNRWQDFIFYSLTRPTNIAGINLGAKSSGAIVVTSGSPITNSPFSSKGSAQTRPSCAINNYLDSAENTDIDNTFESTNMQRTPSYNDQTFVVEP